MAKDEATRSFKGLNNIDDPMALGLEWLKQADNVDITERNGLRSCRGFTKSLTSTALSGAYATDDMLRLYVVDSGELLQVNSDLTQHVLANGLSADPMRFAEINGQVFYTNGTNFGVIVDGAARGWGIAPPAAPQLSVGSGILPAATFQVLCTLTDQRGIESGSGDVAVIKVDDGSQIAISDIPQVAGYTTNVYVTEPDGKVYFLLAEDAGTAVSYNCSPDALSEELTYWNMDPPSGSMPALYDGKMYVAEPIPTVDLTVIWASQPMQYHHFDRGDDAIIVPGLVRFHRAVDEGLVIGTDRKIYLYNGETLAILADYGAVPGWHATLFKKRLYFWTLRGLCRAMPFENMTEGVVSVAPGLSAGAAVMERGGMRRYVVALQRGGDAYNARN